jgi:hypothetical protein
MTKQQIVNGIFKKIINQGGRALCNQTRDCVLETSDGKRCAFSLCLKSSVRKKMIKDGSLGIVNRSLINIYGDIDNMLLKKYHGHSYNFWSNLQSFHDRSSCWVGADLTEYGKSVKDNLINL